MSGGTTPQKSQGTFQKLGGWNTVGQASDFLSGLIGGDKDGYLGKYGSLQQAGDQAFDQASNVVMGINPLVGGIMKAGGLVSDVLTKWGGMGTDSMTKTDAVLGSKLLSLTPVGMVNGFFGKKTRDFLLIEILQNRQEALTVELLEIQHQQKKKLERNMDYSVEGQEGQLIGS